MELRRQTPIIPTVIDSPVLSCPDEGDTWRLDVLLRGMQNSFAVLWQPTLPHGPLDCKGVLGGLGELGAPTSAWSNGSCDVSGATCRILEAK